MKATVIAKQQIPHFSSAKGSVCMSLLNCFSVKMKRNYIKYAFPKLHRQKDHSISYQ